MKTTPTMKNMMTKSMGQQARRGALPVVPHTRTRTITLLTCKEYAVGLDLERRFMLDHSGSRVGGKHAVRRDNTFDNYAMGPPARLATHAAARRQRHRRPAMVPGPRHAAGGGRGAHAEEDDEGEEDEDDEEEPPWDPQCHDLSSSTEVPNVVHLAIPSQIAGRVLGVRGLNLKSVQAHFQVLISADPMMMVVPGPGPQPAGRRLHRVTISRGTPRAREAAAGRIKQLVMQLHNTRAAAAAAAAAQHHQQGEE